MASANFVNVTTAKSILSSGGSATMNFASVTNGAGRAGSNLDLGAYPRPLSWRWYAEITLQATPTVGQSVDLFLVPWDDDAGSARPWGDFANVSGYNSAGFAFGTENDLRNLLFMGSVIVDQAAATKFTGGGIIQIPTRFVTPVWWNRSGATANATASLSLAYLTPIYDEGQ
jgi:hypothetical protein